MCNIFTCIGIICSNMKVLILLLIFVHLHLIMGQGASVEFTLGGYAVLEDDGPAQPVLRLNRPIECCSVSIAVKVQDVTAKGGEDYVVPPNQYVKVIFLAGMTTAKFDIRIIGNDKIGMTKRFRVTIVDLSLSYGSNLRLGSISSATIDILDDDSASLKFRERSLDVYENKGQVMIELVVSVPTPEDFTVNVYSVGIRSRQGACDNFLSEQLEVHFPAGASAVMVPINITNDDVFEFSRTYNVLIDEEMLPDYVVVGDPDLVTIVLREDDNKITANFEESLYRVPEHNGSISPKLNLTRPSPCDFTIHAQLVAYGKPTDYDNDASPKIYNYTFPAGSVSANLAASITITDEMMRNNDTTFQLIVIDAVLPFYVEAVYPATLYTSDIPEIVPGVTVDAININDTTVILTLSWGEPVNNLDPTITYTVSCSGDDTCPPVFSATARNYTISNLITMTDYTFSIIATNSFGTGEAGVLDYTTPPAIGQPSAVVLTCEPVDTINQCTAIWNPVTQGNVLGYQVYYNEEMINAETSTTTLKFTALSLPDAMFTSTIVFTVSAINRYGIGRASEETAVIHAPSVTKIATKLVRSHSITVTCTIHPKSEADHCVVMAIAYNGVTSTGSAPVTNGMATVTVYELRCNTLYTIKAGGTLNHRLLGPRMSHADISTTVCGEVVARNKDDGGGCGGGECVAGGTVGAIIGTGIIVLVTVLVIMFIRKRTRKSARIGPAKITMPSNIQMAVLPSNTEMIMSSNTGKLLSSGD